MYQVCIATPSDLHGPSSWHSIASGRTLSDAIAKARIRLEAYGSVNPGRLFYRRGDDGVRYPLI